MTQPPARMLLAGRPKPAARLAASTVCCGTAALETAFRRTHRPRRPAVGVATMPRHFLKILIAAMLLGALAVAAACWLAYWVAYYAGYSLS